MDDVGVLRVAVGMDWLDVDQAQRLYVGLKEGPDLEVQAKLAALRERVENSTPTCRVLC